MHAARSPVFSALLLALAACAGSSQRKVDSVQLVGNQKVDSGDLLDGIVNHAPSGFIFTSRADYQPMQLTLDQARIESAYRELGYFSARVLDAEVANIDEDEVAITFRVEEGPPTILERVEIYGAPEDPTLDARALAKEAALEMEVPIQYQSYLEARDRVRQVLLNGGYAHAQITGTLAIDRARGRATAIYRLDPGPIAVFGNVDVAGLEKTPDSLVLNRIAWEPGDRFDPMKLEKTRVALYSTGLVSNVHFDWDDDKNQQVLDITVKGSEGSRHELRLGGGVGIDNEHYELRARLGYMHRNFLDPKTTLRFNARPGIAFLPSGNLVGWNLDSDLSLQREDFLFPLWTGKGTIEYALTEVDAFSFTGPALRVSAGRLFFDNQLIFSLGVLYRFQKFLRIEPGLEPIRATIGLDDPLTFAAVEPSITFDTRDDPLAPSRGFYARLPLEIGRVLSGETRSYFKLTPEVRGYVPILDRVVVAGRIRFGTRLLDLGSLPVTQRYASGGAETQRGFGRGRLSPGVPSAEDGSAVPYGGEALLEGNLETRVDVIRLWEQWLSVVTFLDAADVANAIDELRFPALHYAAGAGLRYDTPVGPVRFDLGYRLNRFGPREPDAGQRIAFHLSIGEAF